MGQGTFTFRTGQKQGKLNYLLFVPDHHQKGPDGKWPLILFLHGANERGNNPELLKKEGIPKVIEGQDDLPFLVVSPQCPEKSTWGRHLETVHSLLNHILEDGTADSRRIYLTGISMGGNGVWQLAVRYPGRFAAIAPVCGYGHTSRIFLESVCLLKNVPVWVFHGASDPVVPVEESQKMVNLLRGCGGKVRFTVYPNCGHDSWTRTYQDPKLYEWFLSHTLPE